MTNWEQINCRTDCGQCNHKGAPSAMKGSKYCESLHQGHRPHHDTTLLDKIKARLHLKGIMRASGKIPKDEDDETPSLS